jgi:TDG/mug DNA glycosylase family protein
LLKSGYGITNLVMRTTATADELTAEEMREGGKRLTAKVRRHKPKFLALLGLGAYRAGFGQVKAKVGRQDAQIGQTFIWVLPNPSGLNAHYQAKELARLFSDLKSAVDETLTQDPLSNRSLKLLR